MDAQNFNNQNPNQVQERLSTEEQIEIIERHGFRVIYKPVALMPSDFFSGKDFRNCDGTIETDLDDAIRKLKVRSILAKDPFSEK